MRRGLVLVAALVAAVPAHAAVPRGEAEVVVVLESPPLARAVAGSRALAAPVRRARLDLTTPTSAAYLRALAGEQRAVERRVRRALPRARVVRRYRVVLNALSVAVPARDVARLAGLPGIARVYPSVRYRAQLERSPGAIGAPVLWHSPLSTKGSGMKIGILDDGVDHTHPFLSPRGYAVPHGFPKGNARFTTGKVIAARAFAPPSPRWRYARRPFDPRHSFHGTHVAGIAAGNPLVPAMIRAPVSGIAPRAYLGNYKVLTVPTASGVGLDGNSPQIVAGIEAAVRDGMDVINLSLGEPEIEPSRDLVTAAIDAAADAGVVPVVAAGNDFLDFGAGSVGSPGSAAKAITVGAAATSGAAASVGRFSSAGPTPLSHRLKPDVAAPGVGILSSVPRRAGTWAEFDGTSMAAPHVAGGAALLLERHPSWTVAQLRSALVVTAAPIAAPATRTGGGLVQLPAADRPLLFAQPPSLSFGLLRRGERAVRTVELADAGGGAGVWSVAISSDGDGEGVRLTAPAAVAVPGRLELTAVAAERAPERDVTGFVVLARDGVTRRLPYWAGVTVPTLGPERSGTLTRTGRYRGDTAGRPARVSWYRYPERVGTAVPLAGPEQVFRIRVRKPVANVGVAIVSRARGVRVEPRIVAEGDESRLVGYASLPLNLNPYLASFLEPRLVAGALRPRPGVYDVVFDSRSGATAGRFAFRFWIDDTKPPRVRLLTRSVRRGGRLLLAASDGGSGVDPGSVRAWVDGRPRRASFRRGRIAVPLRGLARGRHRLVLQVSDYQETRNNENVPAILPNTRRVAVTFRVR